MNTYDTLLIMDELGIPLYSARNLTQSLFLIPGMASGSGSIIRRTVNGKLIDLTYSQFRQYGTKITCTDRRAPALDGIFPGQPVTIHCVTELCYPIGSHPSRNSVSGSERTEGHFIFYRPVLKMMITTFSPNTMAEWQQDVTWELTAEEVEPPT